LLLLALIPLGILSVIAYQIAASALEQRSLEHYASVARSRIDSVVAVRQKDVLILEYVAKQKWLRERMRQLGDKNADTAGVLAEVTVHLKELLKASPQFDTGSILDPKGMVLAQTVDFVGTFANRDKTKDTYYTGAMSTPGKHF